MQMRTSHVGELFTASFQIIAVFLLHRILDSTGDRIVDAKDGALNELDLTRRKSLQASATWLLLSLLPCFSRACFAS